MAKYVTRGDLRTRARRLANMQASTEFVDNSVIDDSLNVMAQELYDKLVSASPPDYYSVDSDITTSANTTAYSLPSDFRSLIIVYSKERTDQFRPIRPITDIERMGYRSPQGAYTVTLRYTPVFTDFSSDSSVFDGVSGWDEYIVAMTARDLLMQEESDITAVQQKIAMLEARITNQAANRHQGMPRYITEVENFNLWPSPYAQSVDAYQLRGQYLDIYTRSPVWPWP